MTRIAHLQRHRDLCRRGGILRPALNSPNLVNADMGGEHRDVA